MSQRVLVIGATGTVGSRLVKRLHEKGESVQAATRDPQSAAERLPTPARFVEFDYERPETYAAAVAGADRVFLMARPGDEQADRVAVGLIDEMKRQQVRHVVNLTAMGAERRDDFSLRKVERYLEDSGIPFTHLRPNWFMQIFSGGPLLAGIRAAAAIRVPAADARISFIDARDVADVAAAVLTKPGHCGKAYTLTGPAALDHEEISRAISQAAGRTVRYLPISEEDARRALEAAGMPADRVDRLVGFYRLVRSGMCEPVHDDTETILGRAAIRFNCFATDHADCWR